MNQMERFKNEFSEHKGIHFNNAGLAPISKAVAKRVLKVTTEQLIQGSSVVESSWMPEVIRAKKTVATFLGAQPDEIAWIMNCAHGLSQAAFGYPLAPGDGVVTIDQEYASNFYPWYEACKRTGAQLVVVESEPNLQISIDRLCRAIIPGIKLVAVSWVQFQTGAIIDLVRLGEHCRKVGAHLIVDIAQGLGQLPFSFDDLPVDMIVAPSHKWMCGIVGQAVLAIKPEFMEKLPPLLIGARNFNRMGMTADLAAPMEKSAGRYECGSSGLTPLFALESAAELLFETGVQNVAREISSLVRVLREKLIASDVVSVTPLEQPGGITSFCLPADVEKRLFFLCKERAVTISKRGPFIRTSLHGFNEFAEVDSFIALVREAQALPNKCRAR